MYMQMICNRLKEALTGKMFSQERAGFKEHVRAAFAPEMV